MATQQNKKTSVLLINGAETKRLLVDTWKINAIKPIIVILSLITILSVSLTTLMAQHYIEMKEISSDAMLQAKKAHDAAKIEIDQKLADLEKSDAAIKSLENYLKKRGVRVPKVSFEKKTVIQGKDKQDIQVTYPIPYIGNFSEQVDNLLKVSQRIPLGRPHFGKITSGFGYRNNPFGKKRRELHGGLDFRGKTGEPIRVTANGVVKFAGRQSGYGNVVIVDHGYGIKTYYAHMSAILVKKGQFVSAGKQIGKLGSTGRSTGPHLHYEVRVGGVRKNPRPYIQL